MSDAGKAPKEAPPADHPYLDGERCEVTDMLVEGCAHCRGITAPEDFDALDFHVRQGNY